MLVRLVRVPLPQAAADDDLILLHYFWSDTQKALPLLPVASALWHTGDVGSTKCVYVSTRFFKYSSSSILEVPTLWIHTSNIIIPSFTIKLSAVPLS
jgi:hypothetical protein